MVELPITVVTAARIPMLGTALTAARGAVAGVAARAASKHGFVNIELHGMDFLDARGDGLGFLEKLQPDLGIPLPRKTRTLSNVIRRLLDAGLTPMTLIEASERSVL